MPAPLDLRLPLPTERYDTQDQRETRRLIVGAVVQTGTAMGAVASTSTSALGSTALSLSTNLSVTDSKAVSNSTNVSVADSKAVSDGLHSSKLDSRLTSAGF